MLIGLLRSRHGFRTVPGDVRELLDLRKLVSSAVRQAGGQTVPTKCLHQRRRPHTAMGAYPALREALPGIALIQVIHVRDESAVAEAVDIASAVDGLLLDSGSDQLILIQIEGCLHHQPAIPYMRLNHIAVQEAPIAVSTTTTRSRPGWHSIGVSTPSQRPARPRPRLSRFPLVHRMIHLHRPDHRVDAAPLECVRRRGLGPVDMTKLRVSLARSSMRPSSLRARASRSVVKLPPARRSGSVAGVTGACVCDGSGVKWPRVG